MRISKDKKGVVRAREDGRFSHNWEVVLSKDDQAGIFRQITKCQFCGKYMEKDKILTDQEAREIAFLCGGFD